ncbi:MULTISPECIES: FAD-dependent oxidoreductase [Streptomyces]|uniref:FAD-dependent oxidoreductase n=1 Tax=Streptomyces lonegramiae TaxID=3075524 RepID=A0ABU2XXR3_9ACTN|nr:FAD-dependent oxidoreductase [Streptomyces sp. DSM 41529]MDT0549850.1 FAD-dependent oxidoreductase [Streptomyces sp. DSM 41529]
MSLTQRHQPGDDPGPRAHKEHGGHGGHKDHTDTQVLVVGAGPVGLTMAHELARHGVRVRLVDGAPGPATTSRALATHARTLETYDQMGVAADLLPRGQRVEHFTLHQNGRRLIRLDTDYSRLPTRFPFTLMVDQVITEEVLRTAASRHGVDVEWGMRLTGFEDLGTAVRARLSRADGGVAEIRAGWLVGCDGGHSTVRKKLGLPLLGDSSETWLIADAFVDCDLPRDSIHWMRTPAGTVMMVPFPEPGKWRLLDTTDVDYDGGEAQDAAVARRFTAKIRAGTGRPARVGTPSWVSVFSIQQRMVPRMRAGRVFVAGDAAHVHSPASGQGMNTGVQDAANLAWKLAAVIRGEANTRLLDSYGAERVPVGERLLHSTRFATALVQLRSRTAASLLRAAFGVVRALPPLRARIQRRIMGGMTALDLTYRAGSAVLGETAGTRVAEVGPRRAARSPGWRELTAELARPGWTLLAFATPDQYPSLYALAEAYGGYLSVRTAVPGTPVPGSPVPGSPGEGAPGPLADPDGRLRADLGAEPGGWLLIRPDGYSAARGTAADRPRDALAALGLRPVLYVVGRTGAPRPEVLGGES